MLGPDTYKYTHIYCAIYIMCVCVRIIYMCTHTYWYIYMLYRTHSIENTFYICVLTLDERGHPRVCMYPPPQTTCILLLMWHARGHPRVCMYPPPHMTRILLLMWHARGHPRVCMYPPPHMTCILLLMWHERGHPRVPPRTVLQNVFFLIYEAKHLIKFTCIKYRNYVKRYSHFFVFKIYEAKYFEIFL